MSVETLDGENKYQAEGLGLQAAKKGVIFQSFPPVLHLQLRRFEYDVEKDALVKINDRHEFPFSIDLEEFLDESADRSVSHNYKLHGVLVHSGDLHGGHYFALIKPEKDGRWFKFDDDRVTPVTDKEVLEDNYGGDMLNGLIPPQQRTQARTLKKFTNAYMLVYVRESDLDWVLSPFTETDTPSHLSEYWQRQLFLDGETHNDCRAETGRRARAARGEAQGEGRAAPLPHRQGHHRRPLCAASGL